jgi:hypothetical protein
MNVSNHIGAMLPTPSSSLRFSRAFALAASLSAMGTVGCGSENAPSTIDRAVFIQTYADLRIAAVATDSQRIAVFDRDSILTAHGVNASELELFAEVHAADLDFMREVWNEVELLMDRQPEVVVGN